ncbi:GxxExxY protein [Planctomycetota bacterium]
MNENEISKIVVETAIAIHREIGPGLLESVYEAILCHELNSRRLQVKQQVGIPIRFRDLQFDQGFRADIIVEDKVILELKSIEHVSAVHRKQLLTYLRLSGMKLGLLLNFGEGLMHRGITRLVNGLEEEAK